MPWVRVQVPRHSFCFRVYNLLCRQAHPMLVPFLFWRRAALEVMRRKPVDVIHCGHIFTGLVGYWLWRRTGRPYVMYTYAQEVMPPHLSRGKFCHRALGNLVLGNAEIVFAPSDFTRNQLKHWPIKNDRLLKLPLGVDATYFTPQQASTELVSQLGIRGRPTILTVARLVERKGHDMVLLALPKVLKDIPHAVYLIVGDGPERARLEKLAHKLGLTSHVRFVGQVPDTLPYYRLCDVFIMVSRSIPQKGDFEGFGLVFLEANACGKPVIGGQAGGVPDAIKDEQTGLLVNPQSPHEIASALIRLMSNRSFAAQLGANGLAWVTRKRSWDQSAAVVEQALNGVVSAPG
ncbi:glycosyltransferase family 4 protein [Acidobacteria bacterium AH-259-D05]|nr:glycosyltransferase family 4 protein [Acidobacteria bacterium AH-259-D05]